MLTSHLFFSLFNILWKERTKCLLKIVVITKENNVKFCDLDPSMFGMIHDCESIHPTVLKWIRALVVANVTNQKWFVGHICQNSKSGSIFTFSVEISILPHWNLCTSMHSGGVCAVTKMILKASNIPGLRFKKEITPAQTPPASVTTYILKNMNIQNLAKYSLFR